MYMYRYAIHLIIGCGVSVCIQVWRKILSIYRCGDPFRTHENIFLENWQKCKISKLS